MPLYLMRHGQAARPAAGQSDSARELTTQGRSFLDAQRRSLMTLGWPVQHVLHSPLVRARQTAEIIAPAFGTDPEEESLLQPGLDLSDVQEIVGRYSGDPHLLLVGHQPDIGQLTYRLTGGSVRITEGVLLVIAGPLQTQRAMLRSVYAPEDLMRLGQALDA